MSETTKRGKTAGGVPIETGSPAGHEELSEHSAAEEKQEGHVPKHVHPPTPKPDAKKGTNPKHPGINR